MATPAASISIGALQLGDIVLGRNKEGQLWGAWRHVGIWDGGGIVEGGWGNTDASVSDTKFDALWKGYVVRRDIKTYSYAFVRVLRLRDNSKAVGNGMAGFCQGVLWCAGFTCAELIRKAHHYATGRKTATWIRPDNIANDTMFKVIADI